MDKLIAALEADISDRRGLKWEWNKIDDDVKGEIRSKWRDLIAKRLNVGEPPCTCSYEESEEKTSHSALCMVSKAADLNEWKALAQEFVDLFDPLKPRVSPALFRAVMQGVKAANARLRESLPQKSVPDLREGEPEIVHVLRTGLPLCGFSKTVPKDWPSGHRWVQFSREVKPPHLLCEICKRVEDDL